MKMFKSLILPLAISAAYAPAALAEETTVGTNCIDKVSLSKDSWTNSDGYGNFGSNCNVKIQVKKTDGSTVETQLVERYYNNTGVSASAKQIYQTVSSLDAGTYVATVQAYANYANSVTGYTAPTSGETKHAHVYANINSTDADTAHIITYKEEVMTYINTYDLVFTVTQGQSVEIGLTSDLANTCNWFNIQFCSFTKYNSMEEALKATILKKLDEAVTAHTGYYNNSWGVSDEAKTTYKAVIDAASKVLSEGVASGAAARKVDVDSEIAKLDNALLAFVNAGARPTAGNKFDMTFMIANHSFHGDVNAWTYTTGGAPDLTQWSQYTPGCAEYYQKAFDFNQTIKSLPKGKYNLTVQAFQRPGDPETVIKDMTATTPTNNVDVKLYAGTAEKLICNIAQYTDKLPYLDNPYQMASDSVSGSSKATYFIPNTMCTAQEAFDLGRYVTTLEFACDKGENVTIGLKGGKTSNKEWTIFDNFRLYLTDAIGDCTITTEGDDATTSYIVPTTSRTQMTIKRKFVEGWNSLCLPVAVSVNDLKTALGGTSKATAVKTFSGVTKTQGTSTLTLNFTDATDSIAAGIPVMVKIASADTEAQSYTFPAVTSTEVATKTSRVGKTVSSSTVVIFQGTFVKSVFDGSKKADEFTGIPLAIINGKKIYNYSANRTGKITENGTRAMFAISPTVIPPTPAESSTLSIGAADLDLIVTGLDAVNADAMLPGAAPAGNAMYDLQGRRIAAPAGTFITGGKKYSE